MLLPFCRWLNGHASCHNNHLCCPLPPFPSSMPCPMTHAPLSPPPPPIPQNLVDKPESAQVCRENAIQMVQCKVLRHLELIALRYNTDEDLRADNEYLTEKLTLSVHDLK